MFSVVKKGLVGLFLLALVGSGVGAQAALTGEIAYVQEGNIWVRDLASGQTRQLTTDGQSIQPIWTPDGQGIVFVSGRDGQSNLYRMGADGTNVTRLTTGPAPDTLPSVARDGTIYFVRLNAGSGDSATGAEPSASLIRLDPGETEVYTQPAGLCLPVDLQVYDADHIALATSCGRGKSVALVNLQTRVARDVIEVAPADGCSATSAWAHGSPRLAVVMQRDCDPALGTTVRIVDFSTSPPQARDVFADTGVASVAWSPDDSRLLYTKYNPDAGPAGVWVVATAGGTPQQVADQGITPAWRPAGAAPAPPDTVVPTAPAAVATDTAAPPPATATPAPPAATETPQPPAATATPIPGGAGPCGALVLLALLALAFVWTRLGFRSRG